MEKKKNAQKYKRTHELTQIHIYTYAATCAKGADENDALPYISTLLRRTHGSNIAVLHTSYIWQYGMPHVQSIHHNESGDVSGSHVVYSTWKPNDIVLHIRRRHIQAFMQTYTHTLWNESEMRYEEKNWNHFHFISFVRKWSFAEQKIDCVHDVLK